jgi:hypothetical protein
MEFFDGLLGQLKKSGLSDEESFLIAVRRLGNSSNIGEEFSEIHPSRVWTERVFWMAFGIAGSLFVTSACVLGSSLAHSTYGLSSFWASQVGKILVWIVLGALGVFVAHRGIPGGIADIGRRCISKGTVTIAIFFMLLVPFAQRWYLMVQIERSVGETVRLRGGSSEPRYLFSPEFWWNVSPTMVASIVLGIVMVLLIRKTDRVRRTQKSSLSR